MLTSDDDRDMGNLSEEQESLQDFFNPYLTNSKFEKSTTPLSSDIEANLHMTLIFNKSIESNSYMEHRQPFFLTEQPRKPDIKSILSIILRTKQKSSVRLYIKDAKFHCHMTTLQSYCTFFVERYNRKSIRLPSTEITPMAFISIYYWLLADEAGIKRTGIIELFNAARILGVQELLDQCWYCFDNVLLFKENTAFDLFCETIKYDMSSLQELMLSRVCKYFLTIVASFEFLELNEKAVVYLLQMSNIGVNSEMEIFMACIRWLDHDWITRHIYLLNLMRCVRFKLLPPLFLRFLQTKQETKIFYHLSRCEEVKNEINKAFIYVTKEIYEKNKDPVRYDLTNSKATEQRRWIIDKLCPYHHDLNCPKRQFLSYDDFLDYLSYLQKTNLDYHKNIQLIKDLNGTFKCCSDTDNYMMSLH